MTLTNDKATLSEALKSAERHGWLAYLESEFNQLGKTDTYKKENSSGRCLLHSGMVLRIKRSAVEKVLKFKSRLVARRQLQEDVMYYAELYALVDFIQLVLIVLSVTNNRSLCIDHVDIKGAFLYASLPKSERIYVVA